MANPYLEWIDENQQTQRIEIVDRICMGRTCKGIDPQQRILLQYPLVSRDHAEISWSAGQLQITDNSRNGTWVNDVRMAAGSSKALSDGDTIRIGYSLLRVVYPNVAADFKVDDTSTELTIVSSLEVVVTSLVADMRGFSAYCQTHASADAFGMINEILDQFSKIVEDFKGTVKDYAGDSIVAFWEHQFGEPARQSALACLAAIQQMLSFDKIRIKLSGEYADVENLRMGWGVTTGPVTLSHYGSRTADLAMVGDCINLASRLSGMANKAVAEKILICSRTAKLVKNQLDLKNLGRLSIRGREGREQIYSLNFES
jgi:class 3 adenylate cyclase